MATMAMDLTFACPKCGKKYVWKSTLAGKKVRCKKCESSFRMPADPPLGDDAEEQGPAAGAARSPKQPGRSSHHAKNEGGRPEKKKAAANLAGGARGQIDAGNEANPYDIDDPEEAPKEQAKTPCRECGEEISTKSVICTHCGTNQRTGEKVGGAAAKSKKSEGGIAGTLLKLAIVVALLGGAAASYFLWMK